MKRLARTTRLVRLAHLARLALIPALVLAATSAPGLAVTVWEESVNGDLSGDPDAPTALTFSEGVNRVIGRVMFPDDTRDYLTFEIGPGLALRSLTLVDYMDVGSGGDGDTGYNLIDDGTTSVIPDIDNISEFLGGNHIDSGLVGANLLEDLAQAPLGGVGFDPPLGPGDYTYLIQQTGLELTGYTLDFVVGPEPSSLALLGLAAAGLAVACRRRSR